jgi:hypothetical protein
VRELYAVVTAALTFGKQWKGQRIMLYCDNKSDVLAVQRGKSKSKEMIHLLRVLHFQAALCEFEFEIAHIKGVENIKADLASREEIEEFLKKCPDVTEQVEPTLPPHFSDENWEKNAVERVKGMDWK